MKHLELFENFEGKSIDDVIDFIQPSNPMDSEEYTYYCFGDDEAYYGGVTLDDYMSAIEGSVFREDSNTSKKFGWDFLQTNKQEVLDRCKADLLSSGIEFENNDDILESLINEKNVAVNSELWNQCKSWAKSKYDVWPSAYACGAAAKRYKSKGGKWKKKKKD